MASNTASRAATPHAEGCDATLRVTSMLVEEGNERWASPPYGASLYYSRLDEGSVPRVIAQANGNVYPLVYDSAVGKWTNDGAESDFVARLADKLAGGRLTRETYGLFVHALVAKDRTMRFLEAQRKLFARGPPRVACSIAPPPGVPPLTGATAMHPKPAASAERSPSPLRPDVAPASSLASKVTAMDALAGDLVERLTAAEARAGAAETLLADVADKARKASDESTRQLAEVHAELRAVKQRLEAAEREIAAHLADRAALEAEALAARREANTAVRENERLYMELEMANSKLGELVTAVPSAEHALVDQVAARLLQAMARAPYVLDASAAAAATSPPRRRAESIDNSPDPQDHLAVALAKADAARMIPWSMLALRYTALFEKDDIACKPSSARIRRLARAA